MLSRQLSALIIIRGGAGNIRMSGFVKNQERGCSPGYLIEGSAEIGHNHAHYLIAQQYPVVFPFLFLILIRHAEHEPAAIFFSGGFHVMDQLRKKEIFGGRNNQPDKAAVFQRQGPGHLVGVVSQIPHGGVNPLPGFGTDVNSAVQHS